MPARKPRKRDYIPPTNEVLNRKERASAPTGRAARPARGAANARGGRSAYVYPEPSLSRTLRRLPVYFVMIFILQYFLLKTDADATQTQRLLAAGTVSLLVTVVFAPFMHVMDKFSYNRWKKANPGKVPAGGGSGSSSRDAS